MKRYGIEVKCERTKRGLQMNWLFDWTHHQWYDTKERRDQALEHLIEKEKRDSWVTRRQYRRKER